MIGTTDIPMQPGHSGINLKHIVQMKLLSMKPCSKLLLLTKCHCQLPLHYAWKHHHSVMDHWQRVAWSEELPFILQHVNGHVRIRSLPGELLFPHIQQVIHRPVVAVLCFRKRFCGLLIVVEQTMKAADCLTTYKLHPYILFTSPKWRWNIQARQRSMPQDSNYAVGIPTQSENIKRNSS